MVSKAVLDKEKIYLKQRLSQSAEKLLELSIEVMDAKKDLNRFKDEKIELESEIKLKERTISELSDRLKLAEIKAKMQAEKHIKSLTQLELKVENISFLYNQRGRDIEQVCKSLDRVIFDAELLNITSSPVTMLLMIGLFKEGRDRFY